MDKPILRILIACLSLSSNLAFSQKQIQIDLVQLAKDKKLEAVNRQITVVTDGKYPAVKLNENEDDGLVWIPDVTFSNGTIEVDILGRDVLQKSFVGIGFHVQSARAMDIVYFRPFNFQATDPVRHIHAVQYVSPPDYDWKRLREEQNGKFEKEISPAPTPTDWVHAKIVVQYPQVMVYVNGNTIPSLTVTKLNTNTSGKLALWVGTQSDGQFANLKITQLEH